MPPIRHRSWLPGSGANRIPRSARYAFKSARRMPGSTRTNRRSGSKSRMRLNRVVSRTTPGPIAAPDSDVPDARGVIGTSSSRHTCRTARTSSSASANATARGWTAHGLASVEWVRRIESSVRTFSAPIACSKARRRVASSAEPVIRTAHQRRGLTCPFRTGVSPAAGTTFMSRTAFDGSVPINQDRLRKMTDHGLTEYQARVYLTLLDLGSATASQISPLSKVPRTRIYATMQQLHEKGLVQILPETPLRYKAVPFATHLQTLADDMRSRAKQMDTGLEGLAREFAINAQREPESRGRFEAIYGRKNVRERLLKMYDGATREGTGIGTAKGPGRILGAFMPNLADKAKRGVRLKYAFCFTPDNRGDVTALLKIAEVRHIDFMMPVYMHVFDGKQFLMSHPIPDDDSSYRGDDIAIWTDDLAIADAMSEMAERIWEMGTPAAELLEQDRGAKRVEVTRP